MVMEFSPAEFATLVALATAHTEQAGTFGLFSNVQWPSSNEHQRAEVLRALEDVGALRVTAHGEFTIPRELRETLGV